MTAISGSWAENILLVGESACHSMTDQYYVRLGQLSSSVFELPTLALSIMSAALAQSYSEA